MLALLALLLVQGPVDLPTIDRRRPVVLPQSAAPQPEIEGVLFDSEAHPIAGVRLAARGPQGASRFACTDAKGRFRFEALPWVPEAFVTQAGPDSERAGVRAVWNGVLERGPLRLVARQTHISMDVGQAEALCVQFDPPPRAGWDRGNLYADAGLPGHYPVRSGATYACGLWSPRYGLVETLVKTEQQRHFDVRPPICLPGMPAPRGRVRLTVALPGRGLQVVAALIAPLSGVELAELPPDQGLALERLWTLDLPAGNYRLRLHERDPLGVCEVPDWERRYLCEFEVPLRVLAGETRELTAELRHGTRLRILVDAPGAPEVQVWGLGGLVPRRGPLQFEPPHGGKFVGDFDSIAAGVRRASRQPLPAGVHRLRVTAAGYQTREIEVVTRGEEDLAVDVKLLALRR